MNSENRKRPLGIILWAILHAALIVAVVLAYPWKIDQNLFSIVPGSKISSDIQNAETLFSKRSALQMMLFVGDADARNAMAAADEIGEMLQKSDQIQSVSWMVSDSAYREFSDFVFANRFALQDPSILTWDDSTAAEKFYQNALSRIYGAFGMGNFSRLDEDPYLLASISEERLLKKLSVFSGNLTLRENRMTVQDSGITYVFLNARLGENAPSFASDSHILLDLEKKIESLKEKFPHLRVEKSGVPFHSYESSNQAQKEIGWISGISIGIIFVLLLVVFRSVVPICATLVSILIAILAATGATIAAFHEIHIFTFVFGTSVIGVSIDYALHHFADKDARLRSMLLGFMTTELSYVALGIVNFPLLRQMAFFSMVGLASALLSVVLVFPKISDRMHAQSPRFLRISQIVLAGYAKMGRMPRTIRYILWAVGLLALVPGFFKMQVQTDIRSMYQPPKSLLNSEMKIQGWVNSGISPAYFIVSGNSEEELLEREEILSEKLRVAEKDSLLVSHLSVSEFFPSEKRRARLDSALRRVLPIRYRELCSALKIKPKENWENLGTEKSAALPEQLEGMRDMLFLGNVNGKFYSVVMPLHLQDKFDIHAYEDTENGIYAINKMQIVNAALTELSWTALSLVAFAYFAVFFILSFVYTWMDSLRVVRAPILACLLTLSVFGYAQIPVNFFVIVGLILTLGIGIDYALFFKDSEGHADSTALAVMLSALTTLVSFGSLALSHFAPISVFGLAVLLGISTCFLLSPWTRD